MYLSRNYLNSPGFVMIVGRVARAKGNKKNQQQMFHSLSDAAEIHPQDSVNIYLRQKIERPFLENKNNKLLRILPKQNTALLSYVSQLVLTN